ncbi:MAG TPA: type III-B CRISPR module RAMP protein Cmr4 [Kofleriaceae bacterium]
MKTQPFLLHALSPIHAGTGHAVDVIDLPIARQRATGIPFVPGSSIKGVLRESHRTTDDGDRWRAVFGPDTANASDHAGALVVGDALLLALPVRSFKGTFAWVTSPLLLELAQRDLGGSLAIPTITATCALVGSGSACLYGGVLLLEDLDLAATVDSLAAEWAAWLGARLYPGKNLVEKRLAIVDDETMTFLWETRTQLDARVSIDATGTVKDGALWLEESLPAESVLIGLAAAEPSRFDRVKMKDTEILSHAIKDRSLQVGGKASVGRGRCRLVPAPAANRVTPPISPPLPSRSDARQGARHG